MITTSNKKKKMNPLLIRIISISVVIHIIAGFIAGVVTLATYVLQEDAQFEEPPAVVEETPKEVKVEIRPQQPKIQPMNQLRMRPVANIAIADVAVDLPSVGQTFTVSAGLGGFGRGNLLAGGARGRISLGVSDVNVFGLKARAEKILFIVEANRRMVYDSKGGLHSYRVIKDEITDMVGNLSAGTLFNVMLADGPKIKLFKPQLVSAGAESAAELARWFAPVNSSVKQVGIGKGAKVAQVATKLDKYERYYDGLRRWPSGQAVAQVAMEMNVDAIFQIVGDHAGFNSIRLEPTPNEWAKHKQAVAAIQKKMKTDPKTIAAIAARQAETEAMKKKIGAALASLNKRRAAKGQPPKVMGRNINSQMKELGLKWTTPEPPRIPREPIIWADSKQVRRYFHTLCQELFVEQGRQPPSMNVVLFLAGDEVFPDSKDAAVKDYVGYFKGKMKVIRGLDEIRSATTAKQTSN